MDCRCPSVSLFRACCPNSTTLEMRDQNLAYSPLGAVVSPPSEYNETHLVIAALPSSPAPY